MTPEELMNQINSFDDNDLNGFLKDEKSRLQKELIDEYEELTEQLMDQNKQLKRYVWLAMACVLATVIYLILFNK